MPFPNFGIEFQNLYWNIIFIFRSQNDLIKFLKVINNIEVFESESIQSFKMYIYDIYVSQ